MRVITPYWTNRGLASDLLGEMDRFFEDWKSVDVQSRIYDERTFNPACELVESSEHYLMSLDLPGLKKEDIKIELAEGLLTVSGERKRNTSSAEVKTQRHEKSYGFFKRSFNLPISIEADKVEASYESGVLELYLPKVQSAKPRQIQIQSEKGGFFNRLLGQPSSAEAKTVGAKS